MLQREGALRSGATRRGGIFGEAEKGIPAPYKENRALSKTGPGNGRSERSEGRLKRWAFAGSGSIPLTNVLL